MRDTVEVERGLREIASLLNFVGAPRFRAFAYERAADVVAAVGDVGPLVQGGRLDELEGIGKALAAQITELWESGTSDYLEKLREQAPPGAAELVHVDGLTPKRIVALHEALGIRSAAELLQACERGEVRTIRGFGAKTEARLLETSASFLERKPATQKPVILARAIERANALRDELLEVAGDVYVVGDVRRGEETVKQLDLLVVGEIEPVLTRLGEMPQVLRLDREGRVGRLSEGLTLRVHHAERGAIGSALVRTTGNPAHVHGLNRLAAGRELDLSGARFDSEESLYAALELHYIPPELRLGRDELELAKSDDFSELLQLQHLRGATHCHTTYSDGRNTILEMAQAADAAGLSYITITDHSPSAHYARGASIDQLRQQWDEIAQAQEQTRVRILRGTEADILADGSLDYPDAILEQFDLVIASIHQRYRQSREQMTARLLRALELPVFKIWGHPLGRILNHREPIDCDMLRLLDSMATAPGALEINSDPFRLDLFEPWIRAGRSRNIPFVVSSDAHSTMGLSSVRYGVTMARRGGVRRHEVLNTLEAREFAQRVKVASGIRAHP